MQQQEQCPGSPRVKILYSKHTVRGGVMRWHCAEHNPPDYSARKLAHELVVVQSGGAYSNAERVSDNPLGVVSGNSQPRHPTVMRGSVISF